jgi:hypothetical protein
MFDNYFRGVFAAFLGAGFLDGLVSGWQIDMIKESILRYNESMIDHSQLTFQEKEDRKKQMKQSLEEYIHGVKDLLEREGRLMKDV